MFHARGTPGPRRAATCVDVLPRRPVKLLALATLLFAGAASAEERFAVVVGANAGWANDRPLRHAESDAQHVRDVLVELGGFAADRVILLKDPDTADVRAHLRRLAQNLRGTSAQSLVVFYYSGHADERHLHLRGAPLPHGELYETLRDLPGTVRLAVLDACKSGSILAAKGGRLTAPFEVKVMDELSVRGLAVLTSSGADELSQETRALAGSVFTHHWVSGLRGAADADRDGQVTLSEGYRYAFARTEADTAATAVPQRPAFRFELKGQGEVVLTQPARAVSALVLPKADNERYVVVDSREWQLMAEGRSSAASSVALALAPGDYRVKRVLPEQLEVASVTLKAGARTEVSGLTFTPQALSTGLVKGSPDERDYALRREWRRGEALSLLAAGEAGAALSIFDEILLSRPDDLASLRGRARALTRLAEAYDRLGDRKQERKSLREALAADPSLSEDPDFKSWYQRLQEIESQEQRDVQIRKEVKAEMDRNPRVAKRFGLGFDFFGTRGIFTLVTTFILAEKWFPQFDFDLGGLGFGLGARFVPLGYRFSPFVGAGGRLSSSTLGLKGADSVVKINNEPYAYDELFGKSLHFDVGVQYLGPSGFSAELALGMILYARRNTGELATQFLPTLNIGWYF